MIENQLKSLQDAMLQNCILNFEEIFFETNTSLTFKENIVLPPYLFERIMRKSKDLGWYISIDLLKICLKHRDSLNWRYIDLIYWGRKASITIQELSDIASSTIPLKELSFTTNTVTPEMMMQISNFALTLEHLQINGHFEDSCLCVEKSENTNQIKFPKLKYLSLNLHFVSFQILEMIDIDSFSDSLRFLKLTDFNKYLEPPQEHVAWAFTCKVITILCSCKRLVTLSLARSNLFDWYYLYNLICSLKELKKLNLDGITSYPSGFRSFAKFVMTFPKLKCLEMNGNWTAMDCVNNTNLDYVGIYNRSEKLLPPISSKELGTRKCPNILPTLLYRCEMQYDILDYVFHNLREILKPGDRHSIERLEQGLLRYLEFQPYHDELQGVVLDMIKDIGGSCFRNNFLQKVGRIYHSTKGATAERFYEWSFPLDEFRVFNL